MTRRVLVTGASGFLGRHTLAPLLARGFEVHAVSRAPHQAPGVVSHAADLLDPGAMATLVARVQPTHLLHLAWNVRPGYWRGLDNLDWTAASLSLVRAFAAAGGTRMVVAGTCAEYDWSRSQLDEDAPTRPATLYGAAKHALHGILAAAAPEAGISLAWARVFSCMARTRPPERLVPSVIRPLLAGEPALVGDGRAERDFMHVADVAGALAHVLDHVHEGPVNIATGLCTPIRDVVATLATRLGRPDLVRLGARPTPPNDPPRLAASGAILAGLGFQPRFTLDAGLDDAIAWWRDNRP